MDRVSDERLEELLAHRRAVLSGIRRDWEAEGLKPWQEIEDMEEEAIAILEELQRYRAQRCETCRFWEIAYCELHELYQAKADYCNWWEAEEADDAEVADDLSGGV